MHVARLLLPSRNRFAGQALPQRLARAIGRADASSGHAGARGLFDILPRGWPAAAVTRARDAGDAAGAKWLRADPAYVRGEINGARMLAMSDRLGLDAEAAEALLSALRPVFGDAGMPIDAPAPGRWYLRVEPDAPLPSFADPEEAIGADLFDQLPQGSEGRRWRALFSEAQVILHNHPLNARRAEAGLAPVNTIWFWGGGRLPDRVESPFATLVSDDETLQAFMALAGGTVMPVAGAWATAEGDTAVDLRDERRLDRLCAQWLEPALADVGARRLDSLQLEWGDATRHSIRRGQGLRFWRRPLAPFPATSNP